jgi:hypothetical protein
VPEHIGASLPRERCLWQQNLVVRVDIGDVSAIRNPAEYCGETFHFISAAANTRNDENGVTYQSVVDLLLVVPGQGA